MRNPTDLPAAVRGLVNEWRERHRMGPLWDPELRDLEACILAWHQERVGALEKCTAELGTAVVHGNERALAEGERFGAMEARALLAEAERDHLRADLAVLEQTAGNVLARIHRDGGHYITEHGWKKAAEDAEQIVLTLRADLDAARGEIARLTKRPFVYLRCAYSHEWIAEDETGQVEKGCPWCLAKEADDAKTDRDLRRIMAQEEMKMRLAAEAAARRLRAALELATAVLNRAHAACIQVGGDHRQDGMLCKATMRDVDGVKNETTIALTMAREALTDPK